MTVQKPNLIELCEKIPAFPASVQQVLALTADLNSSPKQLIKVIDHDPVLTMKLLKVANSAYFGLSRDIVSIRHAVVYMGFNTVRHVALAIAAIGVLQRENDAGFDMDDFLLHSLCTAVLTRSLARRMRVREVDAANFFVAGLLHDIGQVVFAQFERDAYQKVLHCAREERTPVYLAEERMLGATHMELGALLGEHWKFPNTLVQAIQMHHVPSSGRQKSTMRDCLFVANLLSARLYEPKNGPPAMEEADLPAWVFRRFGPDLDTILADMPDVEGEMAFATELLRTQR